MKVSPGQILLVLFPRLTPPGHELASTPNVGQKSVDSVE